MLSSAMPEVRAFLRDYPLMALRPSTGTDLVLKGRFSFYAQALDCGAITDSFALTIRVPQNFPRELPMIIETGGRIPRVADFHVNSTDGSLCLGSPLRQMSALSEHPTLVGFAETLLVPYLFAISRKLQSGGKLVFGELAHGAPGSLADYAEMLCLKDPTRALDALKLLGIRKRLANKRLCPCGCKIRLGRCSFNRRLAHLRRMASRSWFRKQYVAARPALGRPAAKASNLRGQAT